MLFSKDKKAVIQATIAAKKDCCKCISFIELFDKSKTDNVSDDKIIGIDKSIEKIVALVLFIPKKRAPVIVTPALLDPGIKART